MQPLYSVDHETRQNSNRAENTSPSPREETPLLHRFPQVTVERRPSMMISVSLLLLLLVTGVGISIYLLVLQSNAENVLPPIETPLQLVSRKQWRALASSEPVSPLDTTIFAKAKQVIIVQTDTRSCLSTDSCARLLWSLQPNMTSSEELLPFNFLVSTNGETFEGLGWHRPSPLFPEYPNTLLLAFIGNFTEASPSKLQIDEAKNFFAESVSQQHLEPNHVIFGKKRVYYPTKLFSSLKSLPRWHSELTDV